MVRLGVLPYRWVFRTESSSAGADLYPNACLQLHSVFIHTLLRLNQTHGSFALYRLTLRGSTLFLHYLAEERVE